MAKIQDVKSKGNLMNAIKAELGCEHGKAKEIYQTIKSLAEEEPSNHSKTQADSDTQSREFVDTLGEFVKQLNNR